MAKSRYAATGHYLLLNERERLIIFVWRWNAGVDLVVACSSDGDSLHAVAAVLWYYKHCCTYGTEVRYIIAVFAIQ